MRLILNGYIGIKFDTVRLNFELLGDCKRYIDEFKCNGKRLLEHNMAPANGGNISMRFDDGFLITCSGCNLGYIEDDEITFVKEFSVEQKFVKYCGSNLPSSETFLHGLLYNEKKDIKSVIHAHDEVATSVNLEGFLDETEREEPYGSIELALLALDTFRRGNNVFVLKNHGYVAVGKSITEVTDLLIDIHNKLMEIKLNQR